MIYRLFIIRLKYILNYLTWLLVAQESYAILLTYIHKIVLVCRCLPLHQVGILPKVASTFKYKIAETTLAIFETHQPFKSMGPHPNANVLRLSV